MTALIDRPGNPLPSHGARLLAMRLIMLLIVLGAIEGSATLICRLVIAPHAPFLVFATDLEQVRRSWATEATVKDQELVWPTDPTVLPRDHSGAKYNPDFPDPKNACASAYGDSFVWGEDIPLADGWVEQLSRLLGCRVANYGVSGYGTDQAYLRFRRTPDDEAPLVMLGIFPENIVRNVNQYRGFLGWPQEPLGIKGRFILGEDGMPEWVPRPRLGPDEFVAMHRTPEKYLPHDYLLPDSRDGPVTMRFPYAWTLAHIMFMPRIRARLQGWPAWRDYYAADHPSGALAVTIAIAEAFDREARQRGKRALVVMLPSASSFRGRARHGEFEYAPLVAALRTAGVDVLDGGDAFLAALNGRSYCALFSQPTHCEGHYGHEGSAILAEVVAAELRRRVP